VAAAVTTSDSDDSDADEDFLEELRKIG